MKNLYLDCFAGISGSMLVGALIDAGASAERLKRSLAQISFASKGEINIFETKQGGIKGIRFCVSCHAAPLSFNEACKAIRTSPLDDYVKNTSLLICDDWIRAYAKVSGLSIDEISLTDSDCAALICIVATAICLEELDVKNIFVTQIFTGMGFVKEENEPCPVPTPIVAELLAGFDIYPGHVEKNLVTSAGAAIIHSLAVKMPRDEAFRYAATAYGVGAQELSFPNLLRLYIYDDISQENQDCLSILETNIDDISPKILSYVCDKLLANGATDAWITPILMRRGLPGHLICAVVRNDLVNICKKIIFAETSSLDIRVRHILRTSIKCQTVTITTRYGPVRCQLGIYHGKVVKISADYDDCRLLAQKNDIPLKNIKSEAVRIAAFKYGL